MTNIARLGGATPTPISDLAVAIDGSHFRETPLTKEQVASSNDDILKMTVANASRVMDFLKTNFGRDGLDGHGEKLEVVVHAPDPMFGDTMNNAYWDTQRGKMFIGD